MSPINPSIRFIPLDVPHAMEICNWRYPPPYDLYNCPDWEWMVKTQFELADPDIRRTQYRGVTYEDDSLVGYVQFFPMEGVTRLGLGLRPDMCGKGLGVLLAQAAAQEALSQRPDHEIDLEVLVWNVRARKAYEKAGFQITDEYMRSTPTGAGHFYCMVYQPESVITQNSWAERLKSCGS